MHKVKPTTAQPVSSGVRRREAVRGREKSNTYVEDPAKTGASDDTSVVKSLYPECESKPAPCAYAISGSFPKKNGDGATGHACYCCRKYEHPAEGFTWGINGRENAEF